MKIIKRIENNSALRIPVGIVLIIFALLGGFLPLIPGFILFIFGLIFLIGAGPVLDYISIIFPESWRRKILKKLKEWDFRLD